MPAASTRHWAKARAYTTPQEGAEPWQRESPSRTTGLQSTQSATRPAPATSMDAAAVPMAPGESHEGPEDALDPNARGDYSQRLDSVRTCR